MIVDSGGVGSVVDVCVGEVVVDKHIFNVVFWSLSIPTFVKKRRSPKSVISHMHVRELVLGVGNCRERSPSDFKVVDDHCHNNDTVVVMTVVKTGLNGVAGVS